MSDLGKMGSAIRDEQRRWFSLRLACAAVWAMELFWAQYVAFDTEPWIRFPWIVQSFRFLLDATLITAVVLLLRRRHVTVILLLNLGVLSVLVTYAQFFHWPMMPIRAFYQWREGWSLRREALGLCSGKTLIVLLTCFAVKFWLMARSGSRGMAEQWRRKAATVACLAYILQVAAAQCTHFRLTVGPNGGFGRSVYAYGYSLPWACELLSSCGIRDHAYRAKAYLAHCYDRITPLESPLTVAGNIVVLQLESVCGNAIAARRDGQLLMPFLNELSTRSMYYRLRAFHRNGSCDMDFAACTMIEPYPGMVPYRVPGLSYTNALPAFARRHGFTTYGFHGNTGLFYERVAVWEQLGFDHLYFKEQLAQRHLSASVIGIRDRDLLQSILQVIHSGRKMYVFGITLDTHVPYRQLRPDEMTLFPHPENAEQRYLNSLRHLDTCLKEFFAGLPAGTTVVLYGDHTAAMATPLFTSDIDEGSEYVGCLIYQEGRDLALQQKTRQLAISRDGSLNLLDVLNYVRHSIERSTSVPKHGPAVTAATQAGCGET